MTALEIALEALREIAKGKWDSHGVQTATAETALARIDAIGKDTP